MLFIVSVAAWSNIITIVSLREVKINSFLTVNAIDFVHAYMQNTSRKYDFQCTLLQHCFSADFQLGLLPYSPNCHLKAIVANISKNVQMTSQTKEETERLPSQKVQLFEKEKIPLDKRNKAEF